jgi:hypothetical protein
VNPDVGFGLVVPSCSWKLFYKRKYEKRQKRKRKELDGAGP